MKNSIYKIIRGGSWDLDQDYACADDRYYLHPDDRFNFIGFRILEITRGDRKIVRGGSWSDDTDGCRSAYRLGWRDPSFRYNRLGFRVLEGHPKS